MVHSFGLTIRLPVPLPLPLGGGGGLAHSRSPTLNHAHSRVPHTHSRVPHAQSRSFPRCALLALVLSFLLLVPCRVCLKGGGVQQAASTRTLAGLSQWALDGCCYFLCTHFRILELWRRYLFFAQTHVCLASARSDGPGHADSQSTTCVSRVSHSPHAACSGGTYIWTLVSCHLCLQQNVAATPRGHFKNRRKVVDQY